MKKLTKEKYKHLLANPIEWNPSDFITVEYYEKWKEYFKVQGHLDATPLYYSKTENFVSAYIIEKTIESHSLFISSASNDSKKLKSYLYLTMMIAYLKKFSLSQTDKTALQTLTQEFIVSANDDLLDIIKEDIVNSSTKIEMFKDAIGAFSLSKNSNGTKVIDEDKSLYFSYVAKASGKVLAKDKKVMSQIKEHISDIQKVFI